MLVQFQKLNLVGESIWTIEKGMIFQQTENSTSLLVDRQTRVFDFELSMDVYVQNKGEVGVLFRIIDPFNYYMLSFKETTVTFITMMLGKVYPIVKHETAFRKTEFYLSITGAKENFKISVTDVKKQGNLCKRS